MERVTNGAASSHAALKSFGLLAFVLACASLAPAHAQNNRYAVERCQDEIRFRIQRDRDAHLSVNFRGAEDYYISNAETGVRGWGLVSGDRFTYDCKINIKFRGLSDASYNFGGGGAGAGTPSWLVGVFRGRSPENRQPVTLTIDSSGYASILYNDGRRDEGEYNGSALRFGSRMVWDIERSGDGFRARYNRRTENFDRTSDGVGGTWRVPSWAIGTFRGATVNGESELRINADGTATAKALATNQTFTGSYADGLLRFDWGSFNVVRDGENIITIEVNNRSNQTAYRRVRGY